MGRDLNQNAPKTDTQEFFNYNRETNYEDEGANGSNSHKKRIRGRAGKYTGTVRENDKASHKFSAIISITVMIGTVIGIIVGIMTGFGVPMALLFIIPSFFIGLIINAIAKKRNG